MEVLGQAKVAQLEELVRGAQVRRGGASLSSSPSRCRSGKRRLWACSLEVLLPRARTLMQVGTKTAAKRRRARSDDRSGLSSSEGDSDESEEDGEEEEEERVPPLHRCTGDTAGRVAGGACGGAQSRAISINARFLPSCGRCPCRGRGTQAQPAAPTAGGGSGATTASDDAHGFRHVYRRKDVPPGAKAWYGQTRRGNQKLSTHTCHSPGEAARAVDRCGLASLPWRLATTRSPHPNGPSPRWL